MDDGIRPPRVLMVTGDHDAWGSPISHHANLLSEALRDTGLEVERFTRARWNLKTLRAATARARAVPGTIVHLHFPMDAFGRSPVPAMLAARTRAVVTVHEASTHGRLRGRASVLPVLARASAAIFTNSFERDFVCRAAPWLRSRSAIVPLATNIPTAPVLSAPEPGRIVGFGTIRPLHGWEQFAEFARLAKFAHPDWKIVAIGRTAPENEEFREEIALRSGNSIEFAGEFEPEQIGTELSRGMLAYIPFWDGISGRRTSNLAAMANGVPVLSNPGKYTTPELRDAVALANSPIEALRLANQLMQTPAERARLAAAGRKYVEARSWPAIAEQTLAVYASAMARAGSGFRAGASSSGSGRPV